jgi:hypothetical protein
MEDDDVIPQLQCDIELNFTGPNDETLNKWAADALRRLADRIEKNGFESGLHDVHDNVGKPIGTLYVDYSGELI